MKSWRFVVHGCGGRSAGFWIPRLLKQPNVKIVGLCDYNTSLCHALLKTRFSDVEPPRIYEDPQAMYDQLAPDAAIIVTAHSLHDQHCRLALDAHCHISVEKPMTTTLDRGIALSQRISEVGKTFQVAFNFPYSERSSGLKDAIAAGTFGRIQTIHASISQPWRTMHRNTWRMDPELSGGGFIHDTGTHLIQAILYLHPSRPVEVFAQIDNLDCPVDILSTVQVRFEDDSMASLTFNGDAPGRCRICLDCEAGGMEFTSLHGHDASVWDAQGQAVSLPDFDKSIRHEHNLLAAMEGRAAVRSSAKDGLDVCAFVEAAYESANQRRPIALKPLNVLT